MDRALAKAVAMDQAVAKTLEEQQDLAKTLARQQADAVQLRQVAVKAEEEYTKICLQLEEPSANINAGQDDGIALDSKGTDFCFKLLQQLSPEQLKKAGADHGISPQEVTDMVSTMAVKFKTWQSVKQPDPVEFEMCIDEEQLRQVAEELVAAGRGEVETGADSQAKEQKRKDSAVSSTIAKLKGVSFKKCKKGTK